MVMKKFFLLFSAVLLLGSCTDLSVSEEEAIKDALPKDFDWKVYAEINSDVKMSQVIFKIREEIAEKEETAENVRNNCVDILKSDLGFAEQIYVDYANCPSAGWNRNKACTGKYANSSGATSTSCSIGACWNGGWDDLGTAAPDFEISLCDSTEFLQENPEILAECEAQRKTLKSFLPNVLDSYKNSRTLRDTTNAINLICKFVPLAENAAEAKSHLESLASNSNINPTLVELHYIEFGRHDGRPYKECKPGNVGEPRTIDLASKKQSGTTVYYDYGEHLFCLNKSTWEIYTTEEE
jgi:hypothetical protein